MQQGGGSQYGVSPDMTSFAATRVLDPLQQQQQQQLMQQQKPGDAVLAEAASPISSRPPARGNFEELGAVAGGFHDEDALAGEETERGLTGNRWPRQETLALLKIRSEMDAAFRDATLKGPLWGEVSRKLAELGYNRSAKKCKEKFENVHKYYKRTKEGRAGRQDGKSYRFFSQLEALHSNTPPPPTLPNPSQPTTTNPVVVPSSARIQPPTAAAATQIGIQRVGPDLTAEPPAGVSVSAAAAVAPPPPPPAAARISFSSNTSLSDSDSEEEMEEGPSTGSRKRKRSESSGGSRKMMTFFEALMREVMEKQEAMQQRFLEAIEKREQDRMIREEAWKRQEMTRLAREHEILAQERTMAASRDAAIIAFLQKLTGQTIQMPQLVAIPAVPPPQPQPEPPPPPPPVVPQQHQQQPQHHQVQQQPQQQQQQSPNVEKFRNQSSSTELVVAQQEMGGSFDQVSSSRWPKSEVLQLIKLRSGLESRYQEAGPKGPLWEEISVGMHQLGFNRSAKRCKEKWENINKYFKKVKESNKKRPEDAKTCPYFHQLDALYRKKILGGGGSSSSSMSNQTKQEQDVNPNPPPQERSDILAIMPPPPPPSQPQPEADIKSSSTSTSTSNKNGGNAEGGSSLQVQTSNGGFPPSFFEEGPLKKPEDIVKELMDHQQTAPDGCDDSDNLDQEEDDDDGDGDDDDDEEEEDEEDSKMAFKIQFQSKNPNSSNGGNPSNSFLAMVQ